MKRERRQQLKTDDAVAPSASSPGQPSAVVLEQLAELHRRYEADEISFDAYDEAKAALLGQLRVE